MAAKPAEAKIKVGMEDSPAWPHHRKRWEEILADCESRIERLTTVRNYCEIMLKNKQPVPADCQPAAVMTNG